MGMSRSPLRAHYKQLANGTGTEGCRSRALQYGNCWSGDCNNMDGKPTVHTMSRSFVAVLLLASALLAAVSAQDAQHKVHSCARKGERKPWCSFLCIDVLV
jgi:hypothetical protein